ncbi:MAG: ABC transporter ATP-binding protein [Gammaproteobacteria bacterium]|nr:MAG: ABC transporter ATP-binding protein [Gammaproteobacteria bacterium]
MGNRRYLFRLSLVLSMLSAVLGFLPFICIWFIVGELIGGGSATSSFLISFFNLSSSPFAQLTAYAWLALAAAMLSVLLYFSALMASHCLAFHVEVTMRKVAMQKIIHMPLGFFADTPTGKIRKIIDDNTGRTHSFLAHQLPDLASMVIVPVLLLLMIVLIDWRMGLVTLIPLALGISSMSFMMSKDGEVFRQQYMDALEEMSNESVEYVRGIPVVKTFGQSVYAFKRFVGSITRYREMVAAFSLLWTKPMSFYTIMMQSTAFFLVPFALLILTYGGDWLQVLSSFVFYLLIAPHFSLLFMRSMYFQNSLSQVKQVMQRFDAILDYPEMSFVNDGEKPSRYDLAFNHVTFAYEGSDRPAVDDVSFHLEQGQTLAIVGASGSGKTTLARLAARFWDVDSGDIRIGGHDIRQLSQKNLMQSIAFVFQNTRLFKQSLRDNITYGTSGASEADIARAIDLSQSRDIIDNLPDDLDTVIGQAGTYLSGGEQQRIALARALLKDAPIVLLDEATAFADPENEHLIQQALRELSKGKTTLMIAHRLTSVQHADRIIVMDKGRIVEQGKHEDLVNAGGAYQRMWQEYQQSVDWKI